MMAIVRISLLVSVIGAGFYFIAVIFCLVSFPESANNSIDPIRPSPVYGTGELIPLILTIDRLSGNRPQIIVLGTSNAAVGVRPQEMSKAFPNYVTHNLAVGMSNIRQSEQIAEMAVSQLSPATAEQSIFVIAISYPQFATTRKLYPSGRTRFEEELLASGWCTIDLNGSPRALTQAEMHSWPRVLNKASLRPLLLANRVAGDFDLFTRSALKGTVDFSYLIFKHDTIQGFHSPGALSQQEINRQLAYRTSLMDELDETIPQEQFEVLEELVHKLIAAGTTVALVDLPLPEWHYQQSPYFKPYRAQLQEVVARFADTAKVHYFDLHDQIPAEYFGDSTHLDPDETWRLVELLQRSFREERIIPTGI